MQCVDTRREHEEAKTDNDTPDWFSLHKLRVDGPTSDNDKRFPRL